MKWQRLIKSGLLLLGLLVFVVHTAAGEPQELADMQLAAENQFLRLYIHPETTEIAVFEKASGAVWYSNPPNWNTLETQARGEAKEQLGAQFLITYDRSDRRNRQANNYTQSISHGLFEIISIPDGVRVEYSLGKKWSDDDYLPVIIEQKKMETEIYVHLSASDLRNFNNRYHLVYLQEHSEIAPLQLQGFDMEKLLNGYEFVVVDDRAAGFESQIAELRDSLAAASEDERADLESSLARVETQLNSYRGQVLRDLLDQITGNRADLSSPLDIKFDDLAQMIDTPTYFLGRVPVFARTALIDAVKACGYTPEQNSEERVLNNLDPLQPNIETFFLPIEYRLDGKSLIARLPMDEVIYPLNVIDNQGQEHTLPLHTITLLPYFGAAYRGAEGYIFMPDGSGAIIDFNSPKYTLSYVSTPIYGRDLTEDSRSQQLVITEQNYMPVYGMKTGNTAFLAVIEKGEALASLNAAKAGFVNSFNYVSPQFKVMPYSDLSLGPIGSVGVYQKRIYQGDIQIRYLFLTDDSADYVGMARAYQDYLVDTYQLEPLKSEQRLPFYLNIIGSIVRNEPILGVPREVVRPLTTYDQTVRIVDYLRSAGLENIKVKYNGWLKGGPKHIFADRVRFDSSVGNEAEFIQMVALLRDQGVEFYPEVSFLIVYRDQLFDGFRVRRDASQYFDNRPRLLRTFDIAFGIPETTDYYILSARSLERVVQAFFADYERLPLQTIALEHMGQRVSSDFRNRPETVVDRQQAADIMKAQLAWIKDSGYDILVTGGNALTYPYVKNIIGVPFTSSRHDIFDASVPFYQIALHGYINYAGEPLNLAADYRESLLKSIAFGGGFHFQWAYQDTELVANTEYNHFYSVNYHDWVSHAVEDYKTADEILTPVISARIIRFLELEQGRYLTEYDNGYQILVDLNQYTVTVQQPDSEPVSYRF